MPTMKGNPHNGLVEIAHGGGGLAGLRLVKELFVRHFDNPALNRLDDGAHLDLSNRLAISTDAFVVDPIFFPGGDIGKLSVCGTVNDVAVCGAKPRVLAAAFVLEEGLPIRDLERVVASMARQASIAGVSVVTGDTKVVPRSRCDGMYITTTGLGERLEGVQVGSHRAQPGDQVLVSGPVGDHGAALMATRSGIELTGDLGSDCCSVAGAVLALLEQVPQVHCLRDPTRGGLTAALYEIAESSKVGIELEEAHIPIADNTRVVGEILGLDPLSLACEGRFLAILPSSCLEPAQEILASRPECPQPTHIGQVTANHPGRVVLNTSIGGTRILNPSQGELLPRIC